MGKGIILINLRDDSEGQLAAHGIFIHNSLF